MDGEEGHVNVPSAARPGNFGVSEGATAPDDSRAIVPITLVERADWGSLVGAETGMMGLADADGNLPSTVDSRSERPDLAGPRDPIGDDRDTGFAGGRRQAGGPAG